MHSFAIFGLSLLGLAVASPQPVCKSVNDACCPQPNGFGPKPAVDSDVAFVSCSQFSSAANSCAVPSGYTKAFTNMKAATQQPDYLGLYTLSAYNPQDCAAKCNAEPKCKGFNLYFERDPSVNPADACPNPSSITNIKCTLYSSQLTDKTATNAGQYRGPKDKNGQAFHVVIAGSNGYSKIVNSGPQCPGFVGPTILPAAINAPVDPVTKHDTYLGEKTFADNIFDPSRCASACTNITDYNLRHPTAQGTAQVCRFFNTYILLKNKTPAGSVCSFYDQAWDSKYATNFGQMRGSDNYTISNSVSYTLAK